MSNEEVLRKYNELNPASKEAVDKLLNRLLAAQKNANGKFPLFGILKGKIRMSDDFDAPLEDFKEYME